MIAEPIHLCRNRPPTGDERMSATTNSGSRRDQRPQTAPAASTLMVRPSWRSVISWLSAESGKHRSATLLTVTDAVAMTFPVWAFNAHYASLLIVAAVAT